MDPVRVEVPAVLNGSTIRQLRRRLEGAFAGDAGVIVLEGGSACFCRGMDLNALGRGGAVEEEIADFARCLELIRLGPKPVVALVSSPASAGGVGLAAAADLLIAAPQATFSLTELLFGLLPAVILPYLLERVSLSKIRLWALSAGTWAAAEAHAAGLVDVVASETDLNRVLPRWVRRMVRAQADAVGLWKRHTAEWSRLQAARGVSVTTGRLREPHVLERIRRFANEEELPWLNPL